MWMILITFLDFHSLKNVQIKQHWDIKAHVLVIIQNVHCYVENARVECKTMHQVC